MPTKLESPHAHLQNLLPWIALASRQLVRKPAFRTQGDAEVFCATRTMHGAQAHVQPIWNIQHDDLLASAVCGWTVVDAVN